MTVQHYAKGNTYWVCVNNSDHPELGWKQKWINTTLTTKGNNVRLANKARDVILMMFNNGYSKEQIGEYIKRNGIEAFLFSQEEFCSNYQVIEKGNAKNTDQSPEGVLFVDAIRKFMRIQESLVDPVTFEGYKDVYDLHIIPYFEELGLYSSEVSVDHIQDYYLDKLEHGKRDGSGGLSVNSVRIHKTLIKQVLDYVVERHWLKVNPSYGAKLAAQQDYKAEWYDIEEAAELLNKCNIPVLKPIIAFTVFYGFRRSEVLGLRWSAFDFKNDTVTVEHTVVKFKKLHKKDKTKTKKSERAYPLLDFIKPIIEQLQKEQEYYRGLYGDDYQGNDHDYIFRWPDGRPVAPDYVSHWFPKMLERLGLRRIRFHDLRHSCAAILYALGYELKDIMEWLGHSSIKMTEHYVHLNVKRKIEMANDYAAKLIAYTAKPSELSEEFEQQCIPVFQGANLENA